ncbi:hypothetical protein BDR03DRAFT_974133 [Suillus americanus]|nr:hypothetical protein BDR03DRAFT_974133 [Suillus americanus]
MIWSIVYVKDEETNFLSDEEAFAKCSLDLLYLSACTSGKKEHDALRNEYLQSSHILPPASKSHSL